MTNEIIVGLDIGTTKIACFVGQKQENGKTQILNYGKCESLGVEHGAVLNIRLAAESIRKAVSQAQEGIAHDIREVYVGVAGQHIRSNSSKGTIMIPAGQPYILEEDVKRLIDQQYGVSLLPGEEIVHLFPQTFRVDDQEINCDPVGVKANKLECDFHMVTGNTSNIECIKCAVEMAGLSIKGLVLEPVASSYACLDDRALEAGVALVDIGGGTTDIALFKEGIIRHTSVLAFAGNVITNDIKEGCTVMKNQAEALKTRFGSCMPSQVSEDDYVSIPVFHGAPEKEIGLRHLANIIKARAEQILEQVNYEIQQSGYSQKLIAGLVLTGGGAQLKHIRDLASYITCIDTRIGLPNEHLDPSTPKELVHPMYSTGIGLVLYGIEKSEQRQQPDDNGGSEPPVAAMPTDNTPDPIDLTDQPTEQEDPTPKEPKTKKPGFVTGVKKSIQSWLDKFATDHSEESIDDE